MALLWYTYRTSARVLFFVGKNATVFAEKILRKGCQREADINGGAVMRVKITLACTECKQRNYNTMKDKKNTPDRLELNKYCRFCRKHTLHRETK